MNTNSQYKQFEDHELAELFPMLEDQDLTELAANIAAHGQKLPIILYEGKVLDGRNREKACLLAGIEPQYKEYDIEKEGDPLEYVWAMNYGRRHLTSSQKAMSAARYAKLKRGDNQHTARAVSLSQAEVAKKFNVSVDSIQRAQKVQEKGIPALNEKVEQGELSVFEASKIANLPRLKQSRLLAKNRTKLVAALNQLQVQTAIRSATIPHDLCIVSNQHVEANDTNFIAWLEWAADGLTIKKGGIKYARMLEGLIEDIEEVEVAQIYSDIQEKILNAIDVGYQRQSEICRLARITSAEFAWATDLLLKGGIVATVEQGGKSDSARGQRKVLWVRKPQAETEFEDKLSYDYDMEDTATA